jgi:oxygen-independent coproporphyrinogen-3 oxidase
MALIKTDDLPSPQEKLEILKMSVEKLTSAGYEFIGMDHFAKSDDDLAKAFHEKRLYRNFQGYSTNAGTDLFALGITSISQFGNVYSQNYKTEKEYYSALDNNEFPILRGYEMTQDDIIRKEVIMRIMCDFELDFDSIEKKFNINFEEYFQFGLNNLDELLEDELISLNKRKITVSEMGRLLIRNVAMNFDGFLERKEDIGKYSRTV